MLNRTSKLLPQILPKSNEEKPKTTTPAATTNKAAEPSKKTSEPANQTAAPAASQAETSTNITSHSQPEGRPAAGARSTAANW